MKCETEVLKEDFMLVVKPFLNRLKEKRITSAVNDKGQWHLEIQRIIKKCLILQASIRIDIETRELFFEIPKAGSVFVREEMKAENRLQSGGGGKVIITLGLKISLFEKGDMSGTGDRALAKEIVLWEAPVIVV